MSTEKNPAPGIPDNDDLTPVPRESIVLGHDGSADAQDALATTLELAGQLNAPVVVVRAWLIDTAPRPASWEFGYVSTFDDYAVAVHDQLVADTAAVVDAHPDVLVQYRAVHGGAAKSLIALSAEARLLVVGSRGRGGLVGMLLGSVSEQCVRHAACPVLVTRPHPRKK